MKYFLIAGEASGDLLGASLMEGIVAKDPHAEFQFWGGDKMAAVAPGLLQHYKDITIMGFVEVLLNLKTIKANLKRCEEQFSSYNPDVLILIDYPGFNMRMAKAAKAYGIKTCYFIAPKIWAWNEKRGKKLEAYVDLLLLIFPFETQYFKKWKVNSVYIGNPMFDQISAFKKDDSFRVAHGLNQKPLIALLPGSRKQEVKRMLPPMLQLTKDYPQYSFVIAGSPGLGKEYYDQFEGISNAHLIFNETRNILAHSEAAVVCSGTASLETAFMNTPHVCVYAAQALTYFIASLVVKVKWASLVNLNLNREAVKELIQDNYNQENLKREFEAILPNGNKREKLLQDYQELHQMFSQKNAALLAADEIMKLI
ncbi:MAG: lipid-A-disaccharide synthase [Bacteroidia bacterium]|nr:lipid-A-disaccharide synthase [Bacteroidia bacterium]